MIFANPQVVYIFLPILLLALLHLYSIRKKKKTIETFAQKELMKRLLPGKAFSMKEFIPLIIIMLSVVALMRPQWGPYDIEKSGGGINIIVAVDTSRSMLAEDVRPNRLEVAKGVIRNFAENLKGDRVGLVAFSGSPFLLCPLTTDIQAFMLSLNSIDTDIIPKGGSGIAGAITESIKGFNGVSKGHSKVILLISDGENNDGDVSGVVEAAKKDGIKVYSIGVGTAEGDLIPLTGEDGAGGFLKDRKGNIVKTSLYEGLLREISAGTGGEYLKAEEVLPERIHRSSLAGINKPEKNNGAARRYAEWFQVPLGVALVIMFADVLSRRKKITWTSEWRERHKGP